MHAQANNIKINCTLLIEKIVQFPRKCYTIINFKIELLYLIMAVKIFFALEK